MSGKLKTVVRNNLTAVVILLATSIVISACGTESFSQETQDQLNSTLDATISQAQSPGALTGIWSPDGTWVVSKGYADLESQLPMETSDIFRIGSVTKTFTSTLVLQLVDDGMLSLDDTLDMYMQEFPNSDSITIRQLLTHTSGIPEWAEDDELRQEVLENPDQGWTVDKMIEIVGEQPLLFEPGADYSYSNVGYFLLGKVIENASGKSVDENIQERIAVPLGLQNTFMPDGPTFDGDVIHGYEEIDGEVTDTTGTDAARVVNYDLAYTAGGMVSTLEDLHIWSKALATGELISEELHREQLPQELQEAPGVPVKSGYGMGVSQNDVWIGHSGAVAGYEVNMAYYPEKDTSIVTFFNKFTSLEPEANAADLASYSDYFFELSKLLYPETYPGVSL